jgi:ABC-type Fe3+ transport system substrate-binding protein
MLNHYYLLFIFINGVVFGFSSLALSKEYEQLNIVTSFGSETTTTFKQAFENKYPDIKIQIIKKKTNTSVKFIEKNHHKNMVDLFWASSPDAFELLKDKNLLFRYDEKITGIPQKVGRAFINDPQGFYKGFAASGYGLMENTYYTKTLNLPPAMEWSDLKDPIYKGHIGISAPSRSGTTHLIVETLLQSKGWSEGWMLWKEISGNIKTITAKSADVPKGVNEGEFGIGIVIDYYALSYKALGFPISFTYPTFTTLVPANIAIIKNAPNKKSAKIFINFILSELGQKILLKEKISRLPINPKAYTDTDRNFPNPFINKLLGAKVKFNTTLSKNRYNIINSLFDIMITYNLNELKAAITAIHTAEKASRKGQLDKEALQWLAQARDLVAWIPIDENKASQRDFNAIFTKNRKKKSTIIIGKQAEIEAVWDMKIKNNYAKAVILAEKALGN